MRQKRFLYLASALLALPLVAAGLDNPSAKFKVSQPTMVPGAVLPPGSYSIHVLDHLQDRFIVRIDQTGSSNHETFIGVPVPSFKNVTSVPGKATWDAAPEGKAALRGFTFGAGASAIEFVYPKEEAVALAKLNGGRVLAVDPASEGQPAQLSSLSKDEMEMVTLWALSPTSVGPNDSAGPQIKAQKYQLVASVKTVKPPLARLPHMASLMPIMLLTGVFSFAGATALRMRRKMVKQTADQWFN